MLCPPRSGSPDVAENFPFNPFPGREFLTTLPCFYQVGVFWSVPCRTRLRSHVRGLAPSYRERGVTFAGHGRQHLRVFDM